MFKSLPVNMELLFSCELFIQTNLHLLLKKRRKFVTDEYTVKRDKSVMKREGPDSTYVTVCGGLFLLPFFDFAGTLVSSLLTKPRHGPFFL